MTPPGDVGKDDVECTASDEVDVMTVLDDDERPISSLVSVKSKTGMIKLEVNRKHVPYSLHTHI